MKRTILFLAALTLLISSCTRKYELNQGPWLGVIMIDSTDRTLDVPFNMVVSLTPDGQKIAEVINAGETILIDEIGISGDTLVMRFPVFMTEILARFSHDSLVGTYYPKGRDAGIAYGFYAIPGVEDRFPGYSEAPAINVTGRWKILENPGTADSSVMVGEFVQDSTGRVTGSVLATSGDYRYLDGKVSGNSFMVSSVDGAHSLLFSGIITSDGKVMNGRFIGSKTWRSKWLAERNDSIRLPRGESLVKVKQGATGFSFKFPGLDGVEVSDVDPRFKDKVVIIQAMGSWCPNCMDEAMFYQQLYSKYNSKGLEIVALSFEDKTFETSKPKMERFVAHTGATYTFLYAGPRGRESIRSVMYVLEGQMAYPTSMVIDKKGKIRRAETGFSGPGTGAYYLDYTAEFTQFIEELLKEE